MPADSDSSQEYQPKEGSEYESSDLDEEELLRQTGRYEHTSYLQLCQNICVSARIL